MFWLGKDFIEIVCSGWSKNGYIDIYSSIGGTNEIMVSISALL